LAFLAKLNRVMIGAVLVVGGVALMAMMAVIVGNSLGRVFFSTPIRLTIEGAGLAGVILISVAIGFAQRERSNIIVGVVYDRFPQRARIILETFTLFLSLVATICLVWAILKSALKSLRMQELTIASNIPIAPFRVIWAAGALILCLFLAWHLIEDIIKGLKK